MLALVAVFAFGAIATTAAFAEETEYLESGGPVTVGALIDSEGELLLADHKGGVFGEEVMVLCSGENLGEVLSSTDVDITAIWELGLSDPEGAGPVKCTVQAGICSNAVATPVNLPWLAELMLEGALIDPLLTSSTGAVGTNPGWTVECSGVAEDTCTGEALLDVKNEPNGTIDFEFLEANAIANCSRGGTGSGLVEGLVLVLSVTAGLSIEVMGS